VGLAGKRWAPKTSLGTLLLASLVPDLLAWPLLIAGIEHARIHPGITVTNSLEMYEIAISHSLLMDAVWGALLAGGYFLCRRYARGAQIVFLLVLSHWLLDFLSHRPDMPLAPGVHRYFGLGLYNSLPGILAVEGVLWLAGVIIYVRCTRPARRAGTYLFWSVVFLLTSLWLLTVGGNAPPDLVRAGISSLIFFSIVLLWAYVTDRLRVFRGDLSQQASGWAAGQD
jgi:hypothetical protein